MNSNRSTFLILSVFLFFSCSPRAQVIFEDNFEGNSLNMDYWNYEEGDGCPNLCGWGNNERQIYSRGQVLSFGILSILLPALWYWKPDL